LIIFVTPAPCKVTFCSACYPTTLPTLLAAALKELSLSPTAVA